MRAEDKSGISGTGYVAEGCQFKNGQCVLHWLSAHDSVNIYKDIEDVLFVHGHEGATTVEWIDSLEEST
jgi:hypothetical protein